MLLFAKYLEANPECKKGETILLHRRLTKAEKLQTVASIQTAPSFIALMTFDLGGTGEISSRRTTFSLQTDTGTHRYELTKLTHN